MKLLFLDLETNGLPQTISFDNYYSYKLSQYYDSSRIIQIAAQVYESDDNKTFAKCSEHNYLIKPDNFTIENSSIHGIEQKTAMADGIEFITAIKKMTDDLKDADLFVAHNVKFDRNVLLSELYRYELTDELKHVLELPVFCTCEESTPITKIKYKTHYKRPKLSELYQYLFNKTPIKSHDALQDTIVMADCFFELIKRGHFAF